MKDAHRAHHLPSHPLQDYLLLFAVLCSFTASKFLGNLWKSLCPFECEALHCPEHESGTSANLNAPGFIWCHLVSPSQEFPIWPMLCIFTSESWRQRTWQKSHCNTPSWDEWLCCYEYVQHSLNLTSIARTVPLRMRRCDLFLRMLHLNQADCCQTCQQSFLHLKSMGMCMQMLWKRLTTYWPEHDKQSFKDYKHHQHHSCLPSITQGISAAAAVNFSLNVSLMFYCIWTHPVQDIRQVPKTEEKMLALKKPTLHFLLNRCLWSNNTE